jgi:hypothetical protein
MLQLGAAVAALAPVVLIAATPAQAAGRTSAVCVHQFTTTISPGFTLAPTSGTQTTNGETGSIACVGTIAGNRITGTGSVGYAMAHRGASCSSEKGSGTVSATIPTTAGAQHLVGVLTVQRTALAIRATGQFVRLRYSGVGVAIPKQGMCPVSPLRRAVLVFTGTLSGA